MQERDRSRRRALQALLGGLGEVLPYVTRANVNAPVQGWYVTLADAHLTSGIASRSDMWFAKDGSLYTGIDTIHAAATIERIHGLIKAQRA